MVGGCNRADSMVRSFSWQLSTRKIAMARSSGDSGIFSRGLSREPATLLKLGSAALRGSSRKPCRGGSGEELLLGSETECRCPAAAKADLNPRDGRAEVSCGDGEEVEGSRFGSEALEVREKGRERVFPLIDSVSFVHEKARPVLVFGVFRSGDDSAEAGGVSVPTGTRWSTSLVERLRLKITSAPSMVAGGGQPWQRGCRAQV